MANVDPTVGKGNPDIVGNNGVVALPQIGEKIATTFATYGADELDPNESCCADSQPGPATPSVPWPGFGGSDSMQDMSGPQNTGSGRGAGSWGRDLMDNPTADRTNNPMGSDL